VKLLYVCTDFPYPPRHGGMVDMWNRIQTLHQLGITVDVLATVAKEPSFQDREVVACLVRNLMFCRRESGRKGLLSLRPGHVAIRSNLRNVQLPDSYDAALLQTEFTSDILRNPTLKAGFTIIRVDNDEFAFHLHTAKAEKSIPLKAYLLFEAFKVKLHTSRTLPRVDKLWFVSHRELEKYEQARSENRGHSIDFLPAGIDISLLDQPSLNGSQVLFVGNLWAQLNREALEWYLTEIHPRLAVVEGYRFAIAGSSRGKKCDWLEELASRHSNVTISYDPDDLTPYYRSSAVFVSPMRKGTGVKLKTVEAVLRGMPVVTTSVGAEGSGLQDHTHCLFAENASDFSVAVQFLLQDKSAACDLARRAQAFIIEHYDQGKALRRLLIPVLEQAGYAPVPQGPGETL